MATVITIHAGNIAIQTEVWTLSREEGKILLKEMDLSKGSYWDNHLGRPFRVAKRNKKETFQVYTAGFSTGEFSNILAANDIKVEKE